MSDVTTSGMSFSHISGPSQDTNPQHMLPSEQEQRLEHWHAMATKTLWLRGMEEGARGLAMSVEGWSAEAKREFHDIVRETTGREFAAIMGSIEMAVAKVPKRKRPALDGFDLRLPRDHVSDHPDGALVEQASSMLRAHGEP